MNKIIEAKDLPEGDKIYLKKDVFGWRIVNPIKDPETGKIVWENLLFGGRRNLLVLIIIMFITLLFFVGIDELIKVTCSQKLEMINETGIFIPNT